MGRERLQGRTIHRLNLATRCDSNLRKFNALIPCHPDVSLIGSLSCSSPEGRALGGVSTRTRGQLNVI